MTTHMRMALAGVLLSCAVLATAVGLTRHAEGDDANPPVTAQGPYVALGDSYTAGPGIPLQTGNPPGCDRSDHNYPSLVAAELGLKGADFKDLSCTGAKIPDLTSPQSTDDGTNPAQLTALSAETRLVTLGIGGNDIGFASLIKRCVTMGVAYQALGSGKHISEDAPCERQYVSITDGTDKVRDKIEQTGERLSATLKEVARRAPQAEIYVVGYPAILPSDGTECGRELPMAPGDVTYLREKEEQLNAMLKQRAEAAGTHYVDTYTPFKGHDACTDKGTRWIEPLLADNAAAVHPNENGQHAMADAVLHTLATSK